MARFYATIKVVIWDDEDFCALSPEAQRTYFMLVTQPDITACGSLPLTQRRWSRTVPECRRDGQGEWLAELAAARFVVIDEDTEELLVRTFAKWDEGYKHAKRRLAVIATAKAIKSPSVRAVAFAELAKLDVHIGGTPQPPATQRVPPDSQSIANDVAPDTRRSVVTEVSTGSTPETTLREQGASGSHEPAPDHPKHCSKHEHWDNDHPCRPWDGSERPRPVQQLIAGTAKGIPA
jgi:hypothetical protein